MKYNSRVFWHKGHGAWAVEVWFLNNNRAHVAMSTMPEQSSRSNYNAGEAAEVTKSLKAALAQKVERLASNQ